MSVTLSRAEAGEEGLMSSYMRPLSQPTRRKRRCSTSALSRMAEDVAISMRRRERTTVDPSVVQPGDCSQRSHELTTS